MKGWTRTIQWVLALTLTLIFAMTAAARADVMTIGVYFRGLVPQEDGSSRQVPLSGSFRVTQGGMDRGVIVAGENVVEVSGSEPVVLTPMAETIPAGWDLSGARMTVNMTDGANLTVPIFVPPVAEGGVPASLQASGEEILTAETGAQAGTAAAESEQKPGTVTIHALTETASGTESGSASVQTAAPAEEAATLVSSRNVSQSTVTEITTPSFQQTPVPTAAPTPEPETAIMTGGDGMGAVRLKAFYDSNSNGDCSVYEKGVAGVQVYLLSQDGTVVTGGKTGAEGEILLPVPPGSYRVRAFLAEEWGFNRKSKDTGLNKSIMNFSAEGSQDSDPIQVRAGETAEHGIGLLKGVVVDGVCWLDVNADGIMDAAEPRLAGVRVTLNGQKNGLSFEAYSDANGYWRIYRLRPGYYDFSSYTPEGMMFTRYSKTGGKNRSVFTTEGKSKATKTLDLNDGRNDLDQNIGFAWQGSVSGTAFLDANYNGLYDEGEKPLAGVKVTAIKQNKDEEIAVAYSGEDGKYLLGGLRGNTYRIRAVLPDDGCNFTVTVEDPYGNHFQARENRRENFWKDFAVRDGENRTVNVGAIYYGSVSGTVYMDDDFSGSLSSGERIAQGVSVSLLDARGAVVDSRQTGAKGSYSFEGLTPGKYSLRMTAQTGYAFSRKGEGNVMLNLSGGEGYSEPFDVPLGEHVTGMDAGMIMPGTVKGTVFADRNDNGRRDSGEAGLAGTRVRLMEESGEAFAQTLGESGEFVFDAVMPGRYYLEYELPENAVFARPGGDSAIAGEGSTGRGEWFDFRTADQKQAPLCGGLTLGKMEGKVFRDADGSGTQEEGDTPLEGMILKLTPGRSELETREAVSDGNGVFTIPDLRPDTYQMTVTLPEGRVLGRTVQVTLPLIPGQQSQETPLTVEMGQTWSDQQLGAVVPGKLQGRAWLDENNDGVMEEGEKLPEGLELTMSDEEDGKVFATLRTDENGFFTHEGVIPGSYSLSCDVDANTDIPPEGDNVFSLENGRLAVHGVTFAEGETREDLVLGMVKYTSLGGMTWIDRGSTTEALQDARISLLNEAGEVIETQTTAESGTWRFNGLMPGTYRIQAELPEGTVVAEPDDERLQTGLISVIQQTDGRRGWSDPMEVKMGQDQLNLNIGSVLPGTIGDFCWLDLNGNGWQDGGELGIPHVKVELVRNGNAVAETETDQYGLYFFREVYPAVYTLRVTAPREVRPTQKRTDIYLIVSALLETEEETAETEEFPVASSSTDFNIDLGYVLRTPGVYPPEYGVQDTQDWSKSYEGVELK